MSAFDILPGDPASPVVLHVPHASTWIPDDVRSRILLDDDALRAELAAMTDAATDVVAAAAARTSEVRPWSFVNRASRLVVDPERFADPGAEEMEEVGMGAVYTATSDLGRLRDHDEEHRADLLDRYFRPYADALADLVDERLAACGRAVVVDVHSYPASVLPYELHREAARPEVCLGTDRDHTPPWLVDAARAAFAGWDLALDQPFAGTYVPTRHHGIDARVSSVMVEIRRDQYVGADGRPVPERLEALGRAVGRLVDTASSAARVEGGGDAPASREVPR